MADELEARLQELEAERARLRSAFARLGDALAATHDPERLLQVVLETALEETGATRAVLVTESGRRLEAGAQLDGPDRLQLPLTAGRHSFATLILTGPHFDIADRLSAASLAAQAAVALENARLHRVVEDQARVDALTGLANRRRCEEALAVEIARAHRFDTDLAVLIADLDDFKRVNDRHGHGAGDELLRAFGEILTEVTRQTDLAGRWGGEEFLLLLPGTDLEGGLLLADRIRVCLERATVPVEERLLLRSTCSIGVAAAAGEKASEALLGAADSALYRAKRGGKNRVAAVPWTGGVRRSA
jgi:diguanylate cyclase (GGDEF)-like protein